MNYYATDIGFHSIFFLFHMENQLEERRFVREQPTSQFLSLIPLSGFHILDHGSIALTISAQERVPNVEQQGVTLITTT